MTETRYAPGECNIGPAEIARRRRGGWIGLVVTLVVFTILVLTEVSPWWRLTLFLPATASAAGFLQAQLHFCFGFSRAGVFNFGEIGEEKRVTDAGALAKDRRRGRQIAAYSAIIGAAVAIVAVLLG